MGSNTRRLWMLAGAAILTLGLFGAAEAELYINEIYSDPGGDGEDARDEYIELRGTPGMSLANHYLIFIESEGNGGQTHVNTGKIDNIFNLGDNPMTDDVDETYSLGSNGFLTMRQKGTFYGPPAAGTTDLVNNGGGPGWGSNDVGGMGSSIKASDDLNEGIIENAGYTAMLIRNDGDPILNAPQLRFDLDQTFDNDGNPATLNDGLDDPNGRPGWVILDSIGVFTEGIEALFGRVYGQVNFGRGNSTRFPAGAEYVNLPYEIEYLGRWGNSTGHTAADWHVSNLTDNTGSGSSGVSVGPPGMVDFRQSRSGTHPASDGDPNTPAPQPAASSLESTKGVPYGTKLNDSLGAPNFIFGDFNKDGYVDAADYTVWRDTLGQTGTEANHPVADPNHDFLVDMLDFNIWKANFGAPGNLTGSGSGMLAGGVPEPATWLLLSAGLAMFAGNLRRR